MTRKQFDGIILNGEELSRALASYKHDKCLDFSTGNIVPLLECSEDDVGEGRAGLQRGKRFIRIPSLDEIRQELKAHYDDERESGYYEGNEEPLPQDPEPKEVGDLLAPAHDAADQEIDWQKRCEELFQNLAAEETLQLWIESLRPAVIVGWLEDKLGVTRVYHPAIKGWVDTR